MASNAKTAVGSQLKRGDGGTPETFAKIAEVLSIDGPSRSLNMIEVTNLDSTGGYEERTPGLKSGGDLKMECNFNSSDATYQSIESDFENRTLRNWKVVSSDAGSATFSFAGYVSELSLKYAVKEAIRFTLTISITGQITRS